MQTKIKDIVNRDIINLTNCEHEPIHVPGSIQEHGFLLGLKGKNYTIDFCSGNCAAYIQLTHQQLLGKTFGSVFGTEAIESFRKYISGNLLITSAPLKISFNDRPFLCSIHKSSDTWIFEAEPATGEAESLSDTYEQTRKFLSYITNTKSLQELCQCVAAGTREITGYDRVMIYRFDEQYNGEVFAESVREDLEPFLGLHYPHTDIPVQARELYLKNLLRLIVDINYNPVALYTVDDATHKTLDLSYSVLRSTSPIHVQYLQNMGVGATLTVSLIHQNRLWGLITCHHYSYKNLSHNLRIAAQLQGHLLTSQIDVRQSNEEYDVAKRSNEALEKFLTTSQGSKAESFNEIICNKYVLDICNATGACIYVNDVFYNHGKTPPQNFIEELINKLHAEHRHIGFSTVRLIDFLSDAAAYCDCAAGLVYHSLSIANKDCIIWFRGETVTEVNWGGDPNKAIVKDENGLHPRNSFKLWKEVVKGKSKHWMKPELNAAANFSYTLQKQVTLTLHAAEEEKYRKLSEMLRENNEELENINWISTHDLQEPLRKIQIMASRLMETDEQELPKGVSSQLGKMYNSAGRMQTLLKDILSYTKIKHAADVAEEVDLNNLVADIISNADENIKDKKAVVRAGKLPVIHGIPFLLKQLFLNLIYNSLKFSDKERQQMITVTAKTNGVHVHGDLYHHIILQDTGIGFEQEFAESIFHIFKRLHSQSEYEGSGVGLALCKKIMASHKGMITANGYPGEGAVFHLHFPR